MPQFKLLSSYEVNEHLEIFIKWIARIERSGPIHKEYFTRNEGDFSRSIHWKYRFPLQWLQRDVEPRMRMRGDSQATRQA